MEQIKYLESTEDEIREALAVARADLRDQISKNQSDNRKNLRERQDERKDVKMFDFNVKKKELDWLLNMYNDPEEVSKISTKQAELEVEKDLWLNDYETECIAEEKDLDDREEEEDNKLSVMEQEEEENSVRSLKQEQYELMQEKKKLIENYEEIKIKISNRM